MTSHGMRIGELAKRADCAVETIRYYERIGLLSSPGRSGGNYRLYDESQFEQLSFIRRCRSLDMAHEEIRALMNVRAAPEEDCTAANLLLDEHIGHVAKRIKKLKALQAELQDLRRLCLRPHAAKDCRILKELSAETELPRRASTAIAHVHGVHASGGKRQARAR